MTNKMIATVLFHLFFGECMCILANVGYAMAPFQFHVVSRGSIPVSLSRY